MPDPFAHTSPELLPVLTELLAREPIFHRPAFASTPGGFDRMLAPDYWEIGASGRRYSRAFVLDMLSRIPPVDAAVEGWQVSQGACRRLGPDAFLLTYTLHQGARRTRRSTFWRRQNGDWTVLFHQGTIIAAEGDDIVPPELAKHRARRIS